MYSDKDASLNKIEQKVFDVLKKLKVRVTTQAKIDKYSVDFLVNDKYIIECYGDFWHCNPQKYAPDYFNKGKKKTAREIWNRDKERRAYFETLGYKFIHLWESDINIGAKKIRTKLKKYLQ